MTGTLEGVTETQLRLLRALGTYRLLNLAQMQRVGVARSLTTLGDAARLLERKRLLNFSEPHLVKGFAVIPRLHWLTDKAAALLDMPDESPHGARRGAGDARQVMHRIKTVDAHIELRLWAAAAGISVGWFVTDFEPGAGGRRKATTIHYDGARYTCDAFAEVAGQDGNSHILVFEIERGRDGRRGSDFRAKLPQLFEVSSRRIVENHFDLEPPARARFLIVHANDGLRENAIGGWPDPDADAWHNFYLKTDCELADFNAAWWRPNGRVQRPLFSSLTLAKPEAARPLPASEGASEAI